LLHQLQLFWHQVIGENSNAGNVAARMIQTSDKTGSDGIGAGCENNGNRRRRRHGCFGRRKVARRRNYSSLVTDQLFGQFRQALEVIFSPAKLYAYIAAVNVASFFQTISE
jgi:hypothetical protein